MEETSKTNRPGEVRPFVAADAVFEEALEESRQGMQSHWQQIDTALLILGRALDAALAIIPEDENRPER